MSLSTTQETVLDELAAGIPEGVTWCVFGSTGAVLHGLDDDPSDVDVLTTEGGAERIRDVFPDEFVETTEVGVSQMDEYRMHGEEIEVVYSERAKDHQEPLVGLESVEVERTADRGVPVLPMQSLVVAYRTMGEHESAAELEEQFGIEFD